MKSSCEFKIPYFNFSTSNDLSNMIKEIHVSPYVERANPHLVLNTIKEANSFADLIEK